MKSLQLFIFKFLGLMMATQLYAEDLIFYDMLEYKQKCLQEIASDPSKGGTYGYPLERVFKTVNADDADYIPKVADAGKVFEENGVTYQVMHNGVKVIAHGYYGSWVTDIIYALRGHHEPQEEKVFYEVLKYIPTDATMIELGSYWGYYSLWFSKAVQRARNYLVEPDPMCKQVGMKNFALNDKQAHFCLGYIQMHATDPITFNRAKRIYIDTFLKENNIEHVHILHSDIQGAEYDMLLSCKEAIRNQIIDYFFVSTHSPGIHDACKKLLLESNYLIIAEHDMGDSCSVDGLIVARRKNIVGPMHVSVKKYP
jgi:hypothetical protein